MNFQNKIKCLGTYQEFVSDWKNRNTGNLKRPMFFQSAGNRVAITKQVVIDKINILKSFSELERTAWFLGLSKKETKELLEKKDIRYTVYILAKNSNRNFFSDNFEKKNYYGFIYKNRV